MESASFTSGSITKHLLRFVGPYMLGLLLQNLYGAVDLFVVGNFATTADVSAVTIGSQIMTMFTQTIIGFATGTTVLVGQYYGEGNRQKLSQSTGTAMPLFGTLAVILTAFLLLFNGPIIHAMQTPPEAIAMTRQYLFVCSLGIVFIFSYNVIASMLMGVGNTKTPFLFVAVACAINIILDLVLVSGFGMGALGAGIATTIAQAGSVFFALLYIKRKGLGFHIERKDVRFHKDLSLKTLKIGGPVALQNALVSVSFLFITAIINRLGLNYSAAAGIVEKMVTFLFIPNFAFCAAVATVSAQNLGAGKPKRSRQSMWYSCMMAFLPSVCFVVLCQIIPETLAGIFSLDPAVVALAAEYLRSYIFDCAAVSFVFCMNGYFNSCGRSWFTLTHSLIATFAVRIPLSFVLTSLPNPTLFVIGWAAPVSSLVSLVLCLVFLFYLDHRKKIKEDDLLHPRLDNG
ncbi:MATE family efflux transporter [Ruminococcaceae bacterium OttesenSCG-928-I18]|nr:MATE family efflux transporter [Ruminococcaceae bacterium OttesenSCG-928-I18]